MPVSLVSWTARPCPAALLRGSMKLTSTRNRFWGQMDVGVEVQSGAAKGLLSAFASGRDMASGAKMESASDSGAWKAVTSAWLPKVRGALWYDFVAPVTVSVRVRVYSTFESEP